MTKQPSNQTVKEHRAMEQKKASAIKVPAGMTVRATMADKSTAKLVFTLADGKGAVFTWKLDRTA